MSMGILADLVYKGTSKKARWKPPDLWKRQTEGGD
jgi:hypothetical protein